MRRTIIVAAVVLSMVSGCVPDERRNAQNSTRYVSEGQRAIFSDDIYKMIVAKEGKILLPKISNARWAFYCEKSGKVWPITEAPAVTVIDEGDGIECTLQVPYVDWELYVVPNDGALPSKSRPIPWDR